MHICFVTSEYPKKGFPHGGIGTFVATIAPLLVARGVRVSVVGLNYENHQVTEWKDGITIYRLKRYPKAKGLQWYLRAKSFGDAIAQIHQEHPIDLVETPENGLAFLPKIDGIRYVIRLHGGHHFFAEGEQRPVNKWKGFQEKRSFKRADAFIAVSSYVKSHTAKYLSYHNKPIEVINYPIQLGYFVPDPELSYDLNRLVFAGTICEKKGIRQLIQAMQIVQHSHPDVYLEVYGRDWHFPNGDSYTAYLMAQFTEAELARVHFKGAVAHTDLPGIYQQAFICVFPSHMETQGLVVPEAMAMERPVVFSKTGPGPETIVPKETGLLCDPFDPADIANQLSWFLTHRAEADEIGKRARKAVLQKFATDPILDQNIQFYKQLITSL